MNKFAFARSPLFPFHRHLCPDKVRYDNFRLHFCPHFQLFNIGYLCLKPQFNTRSPTIPSHTHNSTYLIFLFTSSNHLFLVFRSLINLPRLFPMGKGTMDGFHPLCKDELLQQQFIIILYYQPSLMFLSFVIIVNMICTSSCRCRRLSSDKSESSSARMVALNDSSADLSCFVANKHRAFLK